MSKYFLKIRKHPEVTILWQSSRCCSPDFINLQTVAWVSLNPEDQEGHIIQFGMDSISVSGVMLTLVFSKEGIEEYHHYKRQIETFVITPNTKEDETD